MIATNATRSNAHCLLSAEAVAQAPDESHFTCSPEQGQQLISRLMDGFQEHHGTPGPFFVFSAENRQVHITVFRAQARLDRSVLGRY